jgi:NAD(P)-dependent dehydrogenase (short-subunit alcohol dehydrogenase family)
MILVSGAAGKTGKAVIRALAARGERVHAYVHRQVIGQALGRTIQIETETPETWDARASGPNSYQRETLTRMFSYYAQHGLIGNCNTLRWLLGREPTSLADFARRQA